jgi:Proto-chlorophyllide reductase 57 kD subunit
VRIGAESGNQASSRLRAEGGSAGLAEGLGEAGVSGAGCPFAGMIPGTEEAQVAEPIPVRWTAAAEARLANVPEFVRPMARTGIERFARERGALEVDEKILDAARDFFGM